MASLILSYARSRDIEFVPHELLKFFHGSMMAAIVA